MNGLHLSGTPIVVDYWKIRDVPPRSLFFLTHMHADHTSGLSSSWPYPIHCTPTTAKLLRRKFNIDSRMVVELEIDESRILYVYLPGDDRVSVTVTVLDANHCPGSAMFLFEGYFGTILYTGDFRLSPSMLSHPSLCGSQTIDVLYLDNTYCHPSCQFPSREEATDMIISLIEDNPEFTFILGLHTLGKEDLMVQIATRLSLWIGVLPERLEMLKLLEMADVFSSNVKECQVQVYPFYMVAKNMVTELNTKEATIAILPTCLFHGEGAPKPPRDSCIKVIPYSDHSSFPELQQFVSSVRPRCVRPIVRSFTGNKSVINSRANMAVFNSLLDPSPPTEYEVPVPVQQLLGMRSHEPTSHPHTSLHPRPYPPLIRRRLSAGKSTRGKAKGVQFISPKRKPRQEQLSEITCMSATDSGDLDNKSLQLPKGNEFEGERGSLKLADQKTPTCHSRRTQVFKSPEVTPRRILIPKSPTSGGRPGEPNQPTTPTTTTPTTTAHLPANGAKFHPPSSATVPANGLVGENAKASPSTCSSPQRLPQSSVVSAPVSPTAKYFSLEQGTKDLNRSPETNRSGKKRRLPLTILGGAPKTKAAATGSLLQHMMETCVDSSTNRRDKDATTSVYLPLERFFPKKQPAASGQTLLSSGPQDPSLAHKIRRQDLSSPNVPPVEDSPLAHKIQRLDLTSPAIRRAQAGSREPTAVLSPSEPHTSNTVIGEASGLTVEDVDPDMEEPIVVRKVLPQAMETLNMDGSGARDEGEMESDSESVGNDQKNSAHESPAASSCFCELAREQCVCGVFSYQPQVQRNLSFNEWIDTYISPLSTP